MNPLEMLSKFAAETTFETLPAEVVARAKWVLRDTIAVILGGMAEPENRALADYAAAEYPGRAVIIGHGGRVKPGWAALVHGTAGTTLEMDEGHAFARGHAAIHAATPALALAQSGKALITAFVIGYEVAARAGIATRLRKEVHPFGAWGVLGAAAVGAYFKKLTMLQVKEALEVAASYAIIPSFNTAYQGANVRNTYAGVVNELGLRAVEFYMRGFRGERGGVETAFGHILGDAFNPDVLSDELGQRYEIMRGYFKPYSGCRYSHAAIDAVLYLLREEEIQAEQIQRIDVATYAAAAHLSDPAPTTPLGGRFSVPYIVAAVLTLGSAGPEAFTHDALNDPRILSLAARVNVSENPEYTAMTPAKRPARVRLYFADGATREAAVMGSKGDPDQPMTPNELEAKFYHLSGRLMSREKAAWVWDALEQLETLDDLSEFFSTLGQHKGGGTIH